MQNETPSCSGEDSDYVEGSERKRVRANKKSSSTTTKRKKVARSDFTDSSKQDLQVSTRHPKSLHDIRAVHDVREALLRWFAGVHDAREMPWRKYYNPNLSPEERSQRAYEVWVSEVMLQQTQVVTVIPYYNRWMERYPTLDKLAASNIEEVNALWKGLGYYSRASRLLAGAQKAVKTLGGRLPDNAKDLQDNIPGIGRYSAGAICSIAHGERVPVLDGNVHRLLSRFLAVHARPKSKPTLDLLWEAATKLVQVEDNPPTRDPEAKENSTADMARTQYPGDINQALIELGSTVCKVRDPQCDVCPLRKWCCAYELTNGIKDRNRMMSDLPDMEDQCALCSPILGEHAVMVYPMKVNRKKAREELDIVSVVEWRLSTAPQERWFLLVRRPMDGLLAGLYEFPTSANVSKTISPTTILKQTNDWLSKALRTESQQFKPSRRQDNDVSDSKACRVKDIIPAGDVAHIFSHVKKTYRVQWVILEGGQGPPELAAEINAKNSEASNLGSKFTRDSMWSRLDEVSGANISSGVVKVWNLVKGKWETLQSC